MEVFSFLLVFGLEYLFKNVLHITRKRSFPVIDVAVEEVGLHLPTTTEFGVSSHSGGSNDEFDDGIIFEFLINCEPSLSLGSEFIDTTRRDCCRPLVPLSLGSAVMLLMQIGAFDFSASIKIVRMDSTLFV